MPGSGRAIISDTCNGENEKYCNIMPKPFEAKLRPVISMIG